MTAYINHVSITAPPLRFKKCWKTYDHLLSSIPQSKCLRAGAPASLIVKPIMVLCLPLAGFPAECVCGYTDLLVVVLFWGADIVHNLLVLLKTLFLDEIGFVFFWRNPKA